MVFSPVHIDSLVLRLRRNTEMVVLGVRLQVFHKECLLRRSRHRVACLYRCLPFLPQADFRKPYIVFALDYGEFEFIHTSYVKRHPARHIVFAHYLIRYLPAVGIHGDDSRFIVERLRIVYPSQDEHYGFILSPETEAGMPRHIRCKGTSDRKAGMPVQASGQIHCRRIPSCVFIRPVCIGIHRGQYIDKVSCLRMNLQKRHCQERQDEQYTFHSHKFQEESTMALTSLKSDFSRS